MARYDWQSLMTKWNEAVLASTLRGNHPKSLVKIGWLGKPGASETEISALEQRLGKTLPPSYREFLQFSNGWSTLTHSIETLWSTSEVDWLTVRNQDLIDIWNDPHNEPLPPVSDDEYLQYGVGQTPALRQEHLKTALEISDWGDSAILLLNPQIVTGEGEWEAWFFANWLPGAQRYRSFWELVDEGYESFLSTETALIKHTERENLLASQEESFADKLQTALEWLQERIRQYETIHSQIDDAIAVDYQQGVLAGMRYGEQKVIALLKLPSADQRAIFRALLNDRETRWQTSQTEARSQTTDLFGALLRGPSMDDLQKAMARLSEASKGEGYRLALDTLRQVRL